LTAGDSPIINPTALPSANLKLAAQHGRPMCFTPIHPTRSATAGAEKDPIGSIQPARWLNGWSAAKYPIGWWHRTSRMAWWTGPDRFVPTPRWPPTREAAARMMRRPSFAKRR